MCIHLQGFEMAAVCECLPFYSQTSTISIMASAQNAMRIFRPKY